MSTIPYPTLICGGLTFEDTPLAIREKAAFRPACLPRALALIKAELRLDEAVILSTCNRVEFFGAARDVAHAARAWPEFLRTFHGTGIDFKPYVFQLQGEACVAHLFEVASGLKSMVVGETEILGQVKSAYEQALQERATGKWLNRLFQVSFSVAKIVRTRTAITRGSVSVGSIAVELAEKVFGTLSSCNVMITGAGDTSEKTARALQSRGVGSIIVANRTHERATELAGELGGRAVRWDQWERAAAEVDIIISSTSAPHYVLNRAKVETLLERRAQRPLFLIDLAVPRDIDPETNSLENVHLYDIDDLQEISHLHLAERQEAIARAHDLLRPQLAKFTAWQARELERSAKAREARPADEFAAFLDRALLVIAAQSDDFSTACVEFEQYVSDYKSGRTASRDFSRCLYSRHIPAEERSRFAHALVTLAEELPL